MRPLTRSSLPMLLAALFCPLLLHAQPYERIITDYVHLISEGRSDVVAMNLASLREEYPRQAGVMYIEGLLATDGNEAVRCFRIVADSFPRSPWADDALARLVEVFRRRNIPGEASASEARLLRSYPRSPYVTTQYLQRLGGTPPGDDSLFASRDTGLQRVEYAVQIGAFAVKSNAERLQARFLREGYETDLYENLLDGKHLLYLVWIGTYRTPEDAEREISSIRAKYRVDGVVRARTVWRRW